LQYAIFLVKTELIFTDAQRRLDIVNRGLSGYNTANAVKIFEHLIPSPSCAKVDYLLILFGSNDSSLPHSPSNQHVPLQKYRANIKTMLRHPSVRAHRPKILLVTPPPVNEVQLEAEDLMKGYSAVTRHQKVTAEYANAIREIAEEFEDQGVILVDLWTAMMKEAIKEIPSYMEGSRFLGSKESGDSKGLRSLLIDGIHLSGAGYKVFLKEVLPTIGEGWDDEGSDKPSYIFP
jgi:lysophospholipase L1-like esterase